MSVEHFYSNGRVVDEPVNVAIPMPVPVHSDEIRVYTHIMLEPPVPRLERTRFSGGVNLSALERNKAQLDRYELERLKVYLFDGALHCCPSTFATLSAEITKTGKRVARC